MAPNADFGLDLGGLWFGFWVDTFILPYVVYGFEF
jgi:hypothetical protein